MVPQPLCTNQANNYHWYIELGTFKSISDLLFEVYAVARVANGSCIYPLYNYDND